MAVIQVRLYGKRNRVVPAVIRDVDILRDTLLWYTDWLPQMFDLSGRPLYQDSHWDVPAIWQLKLAQKEYLVKILEAEQQIQGFVVLQVEGFEGSDKRICTYIDFVAAAPWTRQFAVGGRRFRGTGKLLLGAAVMYGYKHTRNWCVQLHALPDAEPFYEKQGMKPTGAEKGGMKEYRLEAPEALALAKFMLNSTVKVSVT